MMKKKAVLCFGLALALILSMGALDFIRVKRFERPIFARPAYTVDKGGSGFYQGIGYAFQIEMLPLQEDMRVGSYEGYLLGSLIMKGIQN